MIHIYLSKKQSCSKTTLVFIKGVGRYHVRLRRNCKVPTQQQIFYEAKHNFAGTEQLPFKSYLHFFHITSYFRSNSRLRDRSLPPCFVLVNSACSNSKTGLIPLPLEGTTDFSGQELNFKSSTIGGRLVIGL